MDYGQLLFVFGVMGLFYAQHVAPMSRRGHEVACVFIGITFVLLWDAWQKRK